MLCVALTALAVLIMLSWITYLAHLVRWLTEGAR